LQLRQAGPGDVPALTDLINRAFLVERFFVDSDRITQSQVEEFLGKGEFLVLADGGVLAGCVYVELRGERAYFGLLSIDPARQRAGLGRRLVDAAEARARASRCAYMDLQIVNVRAELPAIYGKLGYTETGTAPFPPEVPTRLPCHFVRMSKSLQP
jgi:N-acetylglutamate synthase-like GNAT family acetyltransferase